MENYLPENEISYLEKMGIQQKVKEMGFDCVFLQTSYFREIKDENFHKLRCNFIKSHCSKSRSLEKIEITRKCLEDYIDPNKTILTLKDVVVVREVKPEVVVSTTEELTVAMDTQIDEELEDEMYRNEIVSEIQKIRKEKMCSIGQMVNIVIKTGSERMINVVRKFENFIKSEVFANEIQTHLKEDVLTDWEIEFK